MRLNVSKIACISKHKTKRAKALESLEGQAAELGSGTHDYSQKMTAAAMQIAEK